MQSAPFYSAVNNKKLYRVFVALTFFACLHFLRVKLSSQLHQRNKQAKQSATSVDN